MSERTLFLVLGLAMMAYAGYGLLKHSQSGGGIGQPSAGQGGGDPYGDPYSDPYAHNPDM